MFLLHSKLEDYMLPCLNKTILGIECAGCGFQRSIALLIHGDFVQAFLMYPAIYPILGLAGVFVTDIFFKLKNYNKIITILAVLTVTFIIGNFIIKTLIN